MQHPNTPGVSSIRHALSKIRTALRGEGPGTAGNGASDAGAGPAASRYEGTWTPPNEAEAKLLIYCTESEESFAEGGLIDFERLSPLFDASSTVLDLGCGIGRVARYVAPRCAKLWAVDVSQRMLDLAAVRLGESRNITFVHSEDVRIPNVPSASVDMAYSLLVLQHLEREDAFLLLEELRRIIKPDGAVFLSYPNLLSDTYLESFLHYAHSGASTETARARCYTPQEVERLISAAGFSSEIEADTEIRVVARPV